MILDDGYAWNGCVYRSLSLSQVAKAITGSNWNGHRFFGLKAVRNGASNRKGPATPRPKPSLDVGKSPTLAAFAPATRDCSPPLATKEVDSTSSNQSARRPGKRNNRFVAAGRFEAHDRDPKLAKPVRQLLEPRLGPRDHEPFARRANSHLPTCPWRRRFRQ